MRMSNYNQIWAGVWDQLLCWSSVNDGWRHVYVLWSSLSLQMIKTAENNLVLRDEMNKETFLERKMYSFIYLFICIYIFYLSNMNLSVYLSVVLFPVQTSKAAFSRWIICHGCWQMCKHRWSHTNMFLMSEKWLNLSTFLFFKCLLDEHAACSVNSQLCGSWDAQTLCVNMRACVWGRHTVKYCSDRMMWKKNQ